MNKLYAAIIIFFVFFLDQMSKAIVISYFGGNFFSFFIKRYDSYFALKKNVVTPYFNIVYVWNHGISFGLFNSSNGLLIHVWIIIISIFLMLFLLLWINKTSNKLYLFAVSMIFGGAFANVMDRIRCHAVFDFLDFHIGFYHWPAFNIADTFITLGALMIFIQSFNKK